MKLLWVKTDFLHPTTRGGQIRTLEMLRRLHHNHEIHYVAFADPAQPEGVARSGEYCSRAYPIPHRIPERRSALFAWRALSGLFSNLPITVFNCRSAAMRSQIETLLASEKFDAVVCDFLFPAVNMPDLASAIVFQHNVEAMIWKRHAEHAFKPWRRALFGMQASRMLAFERRVCTEARRVIAVSEIDAATMRDLYGIPDIPWVATGVDAEYFQPPHTQPAATSDLVFLGSMDWMPNIDGIKWFCREVLPLIRQTHPGCTLAIAGRRPDPEIRALAERDPHIRVTGTIDDVRPWLWGSTVSVVPLWVGGGTRLKIFEAMAAGVPVISTSIGAEGLDTRHGDHILIADTPADFAAACSALLSDPGCRLNLQNAARRLVLEKYSWEAVAADFEKLLFTR